MSQQVLMMGPIPAAQAKMLEDEYTVHRLWQAEDPEAKLAEVKNNITGVVSTAWFGVSAKLIRALPNLEIISHFGVGYDNVDVQAAKERGVVVTNTPDVLTDDTADVGLALSLAVFRRLVEGDIYVRSGQWAKKGALPLGRSLRGKTMGITGMGRIGLAVAKRAEAFGMKVIYNGPRKKAAYIGLVSEIAKAARIPVRSEGSMELIAAKDVPALLEVVRARSSYMILGLEGFSIVDNGVVPDMAAIADFSMLAGTSDCGASVFEAHRFLSAVDKADLYYDLNITIKYPFFANLEEMAAESDILMVTCPYRPETHHLISAKVLKSLGKDGVLVNIARGKIVDEQALIDALQNGVIAGAGLDVFENEPDVPSALCRLDNVVLQPHVGSATLETRGAMAQLVVDNMRLYFEKAEVLTPV